MNAADGNYYYKTEWNKQTKNKPEIFVSAK